MTRKIAKSAKFPAIIALLILMVMGLNQVFAENPGVDTSQTVPPELIPAKIAYIEAFEEVIQDQVS